MNAEDFAQGSRGYLKLSEMCCHISWLEFGKAETQQLKRVHSLSMCLKPLAQNSHAWKNMRIQTMRFPTNKNA